MAKTTARYTYTAGIPAARIADVIVGAMERAGVDGRQLAAGVGVSRRVARRWAKAAEIPADHEIDSIAKACGADVVELFPHRDVVELDTISQTMRVGSEAVGVALLENDAVLTSYVDLVRIQRGLAPEDEIGLRQEDVEALADSLDLTDMELESRLVRIVGLSRHRAHDVRQAMIRARLAHPSNRPPA